MFRILRIKAKYPSLRSKIDERYFGRLSKRLASRSVYRVRLARANDLIPLAHKKVRRENRDGDHSALPIELPWPKPSTGLEPVTIFEVTVSSLRRI
jgi:hypothetical protein